MRSNDKLTAAITFLRDSGLAVLADEVSRVIAAQVLPHDYVTKGWTVHGRDPVQFGPGPHYGIGGLCVTPQLGRAMTPAEAYADAAAIADTFHKNALEWAKTVRGLESLVTDTDSSKIRDAILARAAEVAADPALSGARPERIPEVWDAGSICNEMYWGKYRGPMLLVDSDLLTAATERAERAEAERDQFAKMWEANQELLSASKEIGFQFDEIARLTARAERLRTALDAFKRFDDRPLVEKRPDVFERHVRQVILAAIASDTATQETGHE